jgi:transcriptional regulator with XRE-family HTH domain
VVFRETLKRELARRQANNARYSLRAFARALHTDHSTLSQIIRGSRRATPRLIRTLGNALRLTTEAIEDTCSTENDLAVLAAIRRPAFKADTRWIATMTGLPMDDVNISLQRLLYLGAIEMSAQGEWRIDEQLGDAVADRRARP